ncbi:hypothetical protein EJ06DRAFT_98792 [Trichodelitschia bisporula]|uniref:Uncharacterized protein n=1 Tax=Trichodelitschia bisporula TaxID=703511 RepID=A0A6G1HRD5_9PEZI|nr:hypothetical protein EJ06DRAFT_98792 [Trichodelitschia bisporula]
MASSSTANFKPLTFTPVNFSLTAGTPIPAPPDSPPDSPRPSTPVGGPLSSHPTTPNDVETKQPEVKPKPVVPQKRPSSVRKLLSLRSIRHRDGSNGPLSPASITDKASTDSLRPGSPYTTNTVFSGATSASSSRQSVLLNGSMSPGGSRKRSGWFGSGGSRRKSGFFPLGGKVDEHGMAVNPVEEETVKGPPPPTLPEFREFASFEATLSSGDIFKDIK